MRVNIWKLGIVLRVMSVTIRGLDICLHVLGSSCRWRPQLDRSTLLVAMDAQTT